MHRQQWESWALCSPLPSRVGTSLLLRAKQGAAPAMGLIPLVCKGGGQNGDGAQYTTPWSIQRQQQGRATAAVAKPDSGAALGGTECLKTREKVQLGCPALSQIFYQYFRSFVYLREQLIFSRDLDIRPTFVFFSVSRSFGRLLENK